MILKKLLNEKNICFLPDNTIIRYSYILKYGENFYGIETYKVTTHVTKLSKNEVYKILINTRVVYDTPNDCSDEKVKEIFEEYKAKDRMNKIEDLKK